MLNRYCRCVAAVWHLLVTPSCLMADKFRQQLQPCFGVTVSTTRFAFLPVFLAVIVVFFVGLLDVDARSDKAGILVADEIVIGIGLCRVLLVESHLHEI